VIVDLPVLVAQVLARAAARLAGRAFGVEVVVSRPRRGGLVALTIDDGPDPSTTPPLLDVLARHGARATFFVIGERAIAHPELLRRIAEGGHEFGNHLLRDEWSVRLPAADFDRQLAQLDDLLSRYGPVRFFRPGSGWFTPRMLRSAARHGYRCALGTPGLVASRYPDPGTVAARMARRCPPGSVVVLHEGTAERAAVAEVTDRLLVDLAGRGLRAVPLAEV
jgi:peptidoglycan/xylan/chitin deacetylase (PgdA/CDA1 family)